MSSLIDLQLVFVTGKGGVGKTTVAAALGQLASDRGKRVLVCEVEPKGDLARAYECGSTPFKGRSVSPLLTAMSMDTEASLREYLKLNLRVPVVGRIGPVARVFDFVATAAPGVREILTIGKLCYEVRERRYDIVIVDASATGHIVGQLAAPAGINDLVNVGPVRTQTSWMLDILSDPARTGACIVATPEEMPVSETLDLAARLGSQTPVVLQAVVANRVLPEPFARGEEQIYEHFAAKSSRTAIRRSIDLPPSDQIVVDEVFASARLAAALRRREAAHLARLRAGLAPQLPLLYVPFQFGRAHGRRAIRQVARSLAEEMGQAGE